MAANAIRSLRQSYRALEVSVDSRLAELPSFRGELNKVRAQTFSPAVAAVADTQVDWAALRAQLPHQSQALDALQTFYEARRAAVQSATPSVSPKVHAAFLDKLRELVRPLAPPLSTFSYFTWFGGAPRCWALTQSPSPVHSPSPPSPSSPSPLPLPSSLSALLPCSIPLHPTSD